MRTIHQYLDKYPISPDSEKLIVGTIHPHPNKEKPFHVDFFYGNVNSLWKIINEAFPNEITPAAEINLNGILTFLSKHKIAMSDTICECERIKPSALDKDLIPKKLNFPIIEHIRNSKINEIFFTSGFGKNNAFKLFYEDILKLKLTPEIKINRSVDLDDKIFGRKIKLTLLFSPSPIALLGIANSKPFLERKNENRKFITNK